MNSELGNRNYGILVWNGATNTQIGGDDPLLGNIIDYTKIYDGVQIDHAGSGTKIQNNEILINKNMGIYIAHTSGVEITDNYIVENQWDGVFITGNTANANKVSENKIWNNGRKGIYLSNGANQNIDAPSISSASQFSASGTTCSGCTVEVYSDNAGQGQYYHGSVLAGASGNWTYNGALKGPNITAINIDVNGNTSEFSNPLTIDYFIFIPHIIR